MPMTGYERLKLHRERAREMKLFGDVSSAIQKEIAEDLQFSLQGHDAGDFRVDWDMSVKTDAFLRGYAVARDLTFDELMDKFNRQIIRDYKRGVRW